ncbi:3'-5' exonuclease, partial [Parabacteroides sp.]|uniref:3'-5' exonuclease n=1 Tax=Parabacteroides sp. TaxID=1869337 RepID=UPI00257C68D8
TIHKVKGLEYPVVFVVDLVNRRFPADLTLKPDKESPHDTPPHPENISIASYFILILRTHHPLLRMP